MLSKVLLVTIPEKGHLNPLIGIAQHLTANNMEVAFFAQADISAQLIKANLNCPCYTPETQLEIPPEFITKGADFAEKIKDKNWLHQWIKTLLIDFVPHQTVAIRNAVVAFQPDVVVADPLVYAAALVAEEMNIPWAGVSNSLNPVTPKTWTCDLVKSLHALSEKRNALFSHLKREVEFRVSDLISPWLNIVYTTEEYAPRNTCDNHFSFYVGTTFPLNQRGDETDFPFEKLKPGKKKVYMSLGSQIYFHPHLFKTVYQALANENVQFIFSVSDLYREGFAHEFDDDTLVLPYVPQLDILKHVDLVVSHGGTNSTLESLAHGVPLVLLPLCNDQFLQAQFIERAKVGKVLNANQPSVETYRPALLEVLRENSPYKENAKRIAASFQNYGGTQQAAELILQLLETRKPILPNF